MNSLWFGTVSFDSFSRFILCLYCFVYYVYNNPTLEVANKLICILLYLVGDGQGVVEKEGICSHITETGKHAGK